jgi:hypothetical protein
MHRLGTTGYDKHIIYNLNNPEQHTEAETRWGSVALDP